MECCNLCELNTFRRNMNISFDEASKSSKTIEALRAEFYHWIIENIPENLCKCLCIWSIDKNFNPFVIKFSQILIIYYENICALNFKRHLRTNNAVQIIGQTIGYHYCHSVDSFAKCAIVKVVLVMCEMLRAIDEYTSLKMGWLSIGN